MQKIHAHTGPKFLLKYFYNHYFLVLNVFLMQNMKKDYW